MQTVGIIGGSGFIGSYITRRFLEQDFTVRVSSTDIANSSKYEHLQQLANANNLSILPLDLRDINTIEKFVAGCDIIIHSGTPFKLDIQDAEAELFNPTVKGTQNFLEIIKDVPGVKKLVFVASVAAWNTSFPLPPATYNTDHVFTENDTPFFSNSDHPYAQAKYLADQVVRTFIIDNPHLHFDIVSVSPVMVIGNALSSRSDSTSMGLQYLFKNKIAPNPFVGMLFAHDVLFSMVDVRDVADAVYRAAISPQIHGKNYLLANESYRVSDITRMLNHQEPVNAPRFIYSNALAVSDLGMSFSDTKTTLNNCV